MEALENKIINVLKKNKDLNILQISSQLELDRHTTSKYLEILKTKGIVDFKAKGKSKQWNLTNNPFTELLGKNEYITTQVLNLLSELNFEISIQSKNYEVIWNNKTQKKGKCYKVLRNKNTKCETCPSEEVFKTGKTQKTIINKKELITQPIKNEAGEVIAIIELTKE